MFNLIRPAIKGQKETIGSKGLAVRALAVILLAIIVAVVVAVIVMQYAPDLFKTLTDLVISPTTD